MKPGMVSRYHINIRFGNLTFIALFLQCFTIEPVSIYLLFLWKNIHNVGQMLNLGSNWGDVHWPDNWTATTVDGKRSAQFEDTLL
jgi:sterol desaturase/sphingolipid hydroxylase (fatty acid hydroxylase superfamily)